MSWHRGYMVSGVHAFPQFSLASEEEGALPSEFRQGWYKLLIQMLLVWPLAKPLGPHILYLHATLLALDSHILPLRICSSPIFLPGQRNPDLLSSHHCLGFRTMGVLSGSYTWTKPWALVNMLLCHPCSLWSSPTGLSTTWNTAWTLLSEVFLKLSEWLLPWGNCRFKLEDPKMLLGHLTSSTLF